MKDQAKEGGGVPRQGAPDSKPPLAAGGARPPRSPFPGRHRQKQQAQVFDYATGGYLQEQPMQSGSHIVQSKGRVVPRLDLKGAKGGSRQGSVCEEPRVEFIEDDPAHGKSGGPADFQMEALYTEGEGYRNYQQNYASCHQMEAVFIDDCMVQMSQADHYSLPIHDVLTIKNNFLNSKTDKKSSIISKLKQGGKRNQLYEVGGAEKEERADRGDQVGDFRHSIGMSVLPDHICQRNLQRDCLVQVSQKSVDKSQQATARKQRANVDTLFQYNRHDDVFVQLSSKVVDKSNKTTVKIGVSEDKRWVAEVQCTKCIDHISQSSNFLDEIFDQVNEDIIEKALKKDPNIDPDKIEAVLTVDDLHELLYQQNEKAIKKSKKKQKLKQEQIQFDEVDNFFGARSLQKLQPRNVKNKNQQYRIFRAWLESHRQFILSKKSSRHGYQSLQEFSLSQYQHVENFKVRLLDRLDNQEYILNMKIPSSKLQSIQALIENKMFSPEALIDIKLDSVHISNYSPGQDMSLVVIFEVHVRFERRTHVYHDAFYCPGINIDAIKQQHRRLLSHKINDDARPTGRRHHKRQSSLKEVISGVTSFIGSRVGSARHSRQGSTGFRFDNIQPVPQAQGNQAAETPSSHGEGHHRRKSSFKIKPLNFTKLNNKETTVHETGSAPITVDLQWADEILSIYSFMEFIPINKSDQSIMATNNNVKDLICTNRQIEVRFIRDDEGTAQLNRGQGICQPFDTINIRTCFLVQQNYQNDQYYLEVQNIKVDLRKAWRAGMLAKKQLKLNGQIEGQIALMDRSYCEKTVYTKLDYETEMGVLSDRDRLFDHQMACRSSPTEHSNLLFIALNSTYIFYTKVLFVKLDESQLALQIDLYSMISAHEQPPTDPATGKAQLIVDDAQWTSDGQFVVFALRGAPSDSVGTLCVLPRLGVSLVRVFNPTRFNLSRNLQSFKGSMVQNSAGNQSFAGGNMRTEDLMKRPQKFIQLIQSEMVSTKLKQQNASRHHAQSFIEKRWRLELWESQDGQDYDVDQDGASYMHIFLSNPGHEVAFQFSLNHHLFRGDLMQIERLFNIQPGNKIETALMAAPEYPASSSVIGSVIGLKKTDKGKGYSQAAKLRQARERNELGFLRFCLTNKDVSQSSQLLMRVPEMLQQWLPLFQYQRIQEQYDKETQVLKDLQREEKAQEKLKKQQEESSDSDSKENDAAKAAKESEKKPKEPDGRNRSSNVGKFGSGMFNGHQSFAGAGSILNGNIEARYQILNKSNEKYEPVKVVASLQRLLTMCRWSDVSGSGSSSSSEGQPLGLLSLNFKQWLLTVVNDCFFFLMHKQEPLLAYYILKISENYFGCRNDPTDYYIQRMAGLGEFQQQVQMEVNQVLLNCKKSYDVVINSLRDPQGEMYSQSSIEHRVKNEINLLQDFVPILFPKNYYDMAASEHYAGLYGGMPARYQFGPLALHSAINVSTTMNFQFFSLKNLFQTQYILLIFYCMIQFRNYQAANFNILSLVIANFISQRQIDPTFLRDYQECLGILMANYLKRQKTTEYEMFLGSTSSNAKFNKVMLGWRNDTYQCFKRFLKLVQKQLLIQKIERVSFHPSQLPLIAPSPPPQAPPAVVEASITDQEDESIEKEVSARKQAEAQKSAMQETNPIEVAPSQKYQEHASQISWKNEILESFDSLSKNLHDRVRKVVQEEHRTLLEDQVEEEDDDREQPEPNLYNQLTERTNNGKPADKGKTSRIAHDDVVVFFRLLNQKPFDHKTRLGEHQALIALEKMLSILKQNVKDTVSYLHSVHELGAKMESEKKAEKKLEASESCEEPATGSLEVRDFFYRNEDKQKKSAPNEADSKRQSTGSKKDPVELLKASEKRFLLQRELETSIEMVRVCLLGLQLKFCKKKGKFWKNNQVSLLSIEVNKLVSLENLQHLPSILKFPSHLFRLYFAANLTQKISSEQHFYSKVQQLNYRLNSALLMRSYLFLEQYALERDFLERQFSDILGLLLKAKQQSDTKRESLLQDAVAHLRINQYFLENNDDLNNVNANQLPDELTKLQHQTYYRIVHALDGGEPGQVAAKWSLEQQQLDEGLPMDAPSNLPEKVQAIERKAVYGQHKQVMSENSHRWQGSDVQLLQVYYECLQMQEQIMEEADKADDFVDSQEKLGRLYAVLPNAFAVALQSRFIAGWIIEAQSLLKYAQSNTLRQAIRQIKGHVVSSSQVPTSNTHRHQKGFLLLKDVLDSQIVQREYLTSMFSRDEGKSKASNKITYKILERFLYLVEKIGFAMRQCDRLQAGERIDKAASSNETQPAQKIKNYEFLDVLKLSEQSFQFNLAGQHSNFVSSCIQLFDQMMQIVSYLLEVQKILHDGQRRRDQLLQNLRENREINQDRRETINQQVSLFKYLACLVDFSEVTVEELKLEEAKGSHQIKQSDQKESGGSSSKLQPTANLLRIVEKKMLLNMMLLQLQNLIKDYQLDLFDDADDVNTIAYSLLLSFDSKAVENEHVMSVQQRVLEIHNLIQKEEQTLSDMAKSDRLEQHTGAEEQPDSQRSNRRRNMQHLIDSLFQFNNFKMAKSDGEVQEERKGELEHLKEIDGIKDGRSRLARNWIEASRGGKENVIGEDCDKSELKEYLKTNWLMKRVDLWMSMNDEEEEEEVDGIGQHLVEEKEDLEEERLRSKAFKVISNLLIYENLSFNRQGSALVDFDPDIISKISLEIRGDDLGRGSNILPTPVVNALLSLPFTSTSKLIHVGQGQRLPKPTPLVQALILQHKASDSNYIEKYFSSSTKISQKTQQADVEKLSCGFDMPAFSSLYQRGCCTTSNASQRHGFTVSLFDSRAGMATQSTVINKLKQLDGEHQKQRAGHQESVEAPSAKNLASAPPASNPSIQVLNQSSNISVRMHKLGRVGKGAESTAGWRDKQARGDAASKTDKVRLGDLNVSKISVDKKNDEGKHGGLKAPGKIFEIDQKKTPPMRFVLMKSRAQPLGRLGEGHEGEVTAQRPIVGVLDLAPADRFPPFTLFHMARAGVEKEDQQPSGGVAKFTAVKELADVPRQTRA